MSILLAIALASASGEVHRSCEQFATMGSSIITARSQGVSYKDLLNLPAYKKIEYTVAGDFYHAIVMAGYSIEVYIANQDSVNTAKVIYARSVYSSCMKEFGK